MKICFRIYTKELIQINTECYWVFKLLDISYFENESDEYFPVRITNSFETSQEAENMLSKLFQLKKEDKIDFYFNSDCFIIQKEYLK